MGASLPSQGLKRKLPQLHNRCVIYTQTHKDLLMFSQLWPFTQFYRRLSRYIVVRAISNLFNCQVHLSSGAFHTSLDTQPQEQLQKQDIPRHCLCQCKLLKLLSINDVSIGIQLFALSLSHCLMSQPGPRAPLDVFVWLCVCVCVRDSLPALELTVSYVRATYKYVRITDCVCCPSLSLSLSLPLWLVEARLWFLNFSSFLFFSGTFHLAIVWLLHPFFFGFLHTLPTYLETGYSCFTTQFVQHTFPRSERRKYIISSS